MKGICDKAMYEHSAPHYQIRERGQTLPPFPCQNWRPVEELCAECGHPRSNHVVRFGGICVGCPCGEFKGAKA